MSGDARQNRGSVQLAPSKSPTKYLLWYNPPRFWFRQLSCRNLLLVLCLRCVWAFDAAKFGKMMYPSAGDLCSGTTPFLSGARLITRINTSTRCRRLAFVPDLESGTSCSEEHWMSFY